MVRIEPHPGPNVEKTSIVTSLIEISMPLRNETGSNKLNSIYLSNAPGRKRNRRKHNPMTNMITKNEYRINRPICSSKIFLGNSLKNNLIGILLDLTKSVDFRRIKVAMTQMMAV